MPTYHFHADAGVLTSVHKASLAEGVTRVHHLATGAPSSFAQVLFSEIGPGEHFIGGRPVELGGVHLHGHIRDGRSPEVKSALAERLRDVVASVTGLPADLVWVYLSEIPAAQMIEFGRLLPPPGAEDAWIGALPAHVGDRLRELDRRSRPEGGLA